MNKIRATLLTLGLPLILAAAPVKSPPKPVAQVKAAAQSVVQQRFLVQEDADRLVLEADASGVLR